jgi:hypothetical protein
VDLMTQVLILFGVFLLALMLHYFIVMEGFQGGTTQESTGQTPFSELIDKLTFFSTPPAPPAVVVQTVAAADATTTAAKAADTKATDTKAADTKAADTKATDAKAAEASATKADAKKVEGAPTTETSTKDVKVGPKDTANESVAERSKAPLIPESISSKVTDALQQGKEYIRSGCRPKPRPQPAPCPAPEPSCPEPSCPEPKPVPFPCNSSDYIRKDQIPCWGCSLK